MFTSDHNQNELEPSVVEWVIYVNHSLYDGNVEPFTIVLSFDMAIQLSAGNPDLWAALIELIEDEIREGTT